MAGFALIQESLGTNIFLDKDNIMDFGEHIKSPPAWALVANLLVKDPVLDSFVKGLHDDSLYFSASR